MNASGKVRKARYAIVHLDAGHTPTGNPKRCFVVYDLWRDHPYDYGRIVGVYDEGYNGRHIVPDKYRKSRSGCVELGKFNTTTAEYREMLKNHPEGEV